MQMALKLSGLEKRYAGQEVLRGVDLSLPAGESLALVGVNGAGKTTLIKSLLDFGDIDRGRIEIYGQDHRQTQSRARLAFLPERFSPPYYLTGGDFLRYYIRLQGGDYEETEAMGMLRRLDLDVSALGKTVAQLSKGMAQKLGLAAVFLSKRQLLILDEPMSGLDPRARALLRSCLQELKAAGRSLFITTHLLEDVELLCDRMAILGDGRILFLGTPERCRQRYSRDTLEQAFLECISNAVTGRFKE